METGSWVVVTSLLFFLYFMGLVLFFVRLSLLLHFCFFAGEENSHVQRQGGSILAWVLVGSAGFFLACTRGLSSACIPRNARGCCLLFSFQLSLRRG